jgi:CheY-like chemotaxis protein
MVVDDERDHADGIVEALGKLPVKALAVYTGEDAVQVLQNQRVDVVVTDLKLEGRVDGLDVLREARQNGHSTEVILITAYATIENCKEAIPGGVRLPGQAPDIDQLRTLVGSQPKAARPTPACQVWTGDAFFFEASGRQCVMQGSSRSSAGWR